MNQKPVNCLKCRHYYTTWDPELPRGCRKFQFKSRAIPAQIVRQSTGEDCLAYAPKEAKLTKKLD